MDERRNGKRVLVVEDDGAIAEVLNALLKDEGYRVSVLGALGPDAIRTAVGRLEPDCVVLDGESSGGYGTSWTEAAWLQGRSRTIPVVMLTGHAQDVNEARAAASPRSLAARFHGVVAKPFDLDELAVAVANAVGAASPFDESADADAARSEQLGSALRAGGLADVVTSRRREWASFAAGGGTRWLLYWSQLDGVYYLVRERRGAPGFEQVGRFYDLEAAIEVSRVVGSNDLPAVAADAVTAPRV